MRPVWILNKRVWLANAMVYDLTSATTKASHALLY
jgi:hypothetical protein